MRNLPNIYTNYSPGLPVLNGVPGSLVDVFKKVLVTGTDPVSFTNIEVLNGVATITSLVEDQLFFNGSRISVTGCDEPLLNGIQDVIEHGLFNFKFNTSVADGTYGGNIKISQPPAGWVILYSGTNEAVFTSGNLDTIGACIKISDTNAHYASIEVYENMTSLSIGINKFNTSTLGLNRVFRIYKSRFATTEEVSWWLAADNTTVHFANERLSSSYGNIQSKTYFPGFRGGSITSFGQCEPDNNAEKQNFYFCGRAALNTGSGAMQSFESTFTYSVGHYNSTTSSITVPSPTVNGCLLTKTASLNSWKFFAVNSSMPFGSNRISGSATFIKQDNRASAFSYIADTMAFMIESYSGQGISIFGRIKEVIYFQQQLYKTTRNFTQIVINGKKYICLPINDNNTGLNPNDYNPNYTGMIGVLIGEKWGD